MPLRASRLHTQHIIMLEAVDALLEHEAFLSASQAKLLSSKAFIALGQSYMSRLAEVGLLIQTG